ncbi:SNF2-related protein [Methylobacillus methanolivorans]|uniref:SNF2-related protein n=1 Tax=Methylobacillus methanolivorans TaxID=1848927 RepID=A0ABW8GLG5_9PROT
MTGLQLTEYQSQYFSWLLTRRVSGDNVEYLASTLVDSQVDASLFACSNPLSRGVILADEVRLGKTIEAGLVISQHWSERRRKALIIVPANLRKQWHQELQDKFNLQGLILEAKNYKAMCKEGFTQSFLHTNGPVICSYQFAKAKADFESRKNELLREINQRNLGYFEQEMQKLDAWTDDLKLGLKQEIKAIDGEIKEVRRTAAASPTLEDKLSWQKKQRELSAPSCGGNCSAGRTKWKLSATTSSVSWNCSFNSKWPSRHYSPLNGNLNNVVDHTKN